MADVAEYGKFVTSNVLGCTAVNATLSKIDAGGRLIIPAYVRQALQLEYGSPVVLTLVDGELRVCSVAFAMAELQAQASSYLADDGASVDAFLAARRAEAAKEGQTLPDIQDQVDAGTMEPGRDA